MEVRRTTLALAATLLLALPLGVQSARAATVLGSGDADQDPDTFTCEVYACAPGSSVGFRQFALRGADVVVEEAGVLVSARVNAKRLAGIEQPRIAVLRPAEDDDIGVTVAGFAPIPIVSKDAEVHEVQDLHLPVEPGDSVGILLPGGEVDLGVRMRPQPDGAVQWFTEPCMPCHMDGGTGRELLLEARIEPDEDEDRLGDETQDTDFGMDDDQLDPPEADEYDDWFDELEEDEEEEAVVRRVRKLRLLDLARARNGDVFVQVGTPRRGMLGGIVTTSAGRWDLGVPRTLAAARELRNKRVARVQLRLRLSPTGRRVANKRGRQRARVVVYHVSPGGIRVTMRQIRL
jgi:hypothetical protein